MSTRVWWVSAAPLLALATVSVPTSARACSCAPFHVRSTVPAEDAVDVPIDIAPLIVGAFEGAEITWTKADGTAVPFALTRGVSLAACSEQLELVPESELEQNAEYQITIAEAGPASGPPTSTLRFTTGAARVAVVPLSPPQATVSLAADYREVAFDSCFTTVSGCADLGDVETEIVFRGASSTARTVATGAFVIERLPHETTCVELRTRDAAGRRSEPVELCGDALPIDRSLRTRDPGNYEDYRTRCESGRVGSASSGDGCSVTGATPVAGAWSVPALLVWWRQRRARGASA